MKFIEVALGIDIGGTNTDVGLVDAFGCIYDKRNIPTNSCEPADALFDRLFGAYREMVAGGEHHYRLIGIGIGAPNGNYYRGTVEHPPNLSWDVVNVVDIVKRHMKEPCILTNDANAAALGEMVFGAARGMKDFVEITLGTGLGSGIVVNGQLVYGHDGFAGEIGHTVVEPMGRRCACGKLGCLEAYASATGIVNTVKGLLRLESNRTNPLGEIPSVSLSSKLIYDAARAGNPVALEAFEFTGRMLGEGMANTVAHLNPEAIIFFGGLALAGDLLFKPTARHLEKNVFTVYKGKTKLLPSQLPERDAAVLGASALVFSSV